MITTIEEFEKAKKELYKLRLNLTLENLLYQREISGVVDGVRHTVVMSGPNPIILESLEKRIRDLEISVERYRLAFGRPIPRPTFVHLWGRYPKMADAPS